MGGIASVEVALAAMLWLMVLVALCTVAQVWLGNYESVRIFIDSAFLSFRPIAGWPAIPILPAGGATGAVLILNLTAAMFVRLSLTWRKLGLWLTHVGLILLLGGQFVTGALQSESRMILPQGESVSEMESAHSSSFRKLPFSLTLKRFTSDYYPYTNIPRAFSSLVELDNPLRHVHRQVLISMNHPLRYGGFAFYQASFVQGGKSSILEVTRNPGWLLPYAACLMIGSGLLLHFLGKLRRGAHV